MRKVEPLKAEIKALEWLDKLIASYHGNLPDSIHISKEMAADVRHSRGRRDDPRDTEDYLNFTTYRGIRLIVIGE